MREDYRLITITLCLTISTLHNDKGMIYDEGTV